MSSLSNALHPVKTVGKTIHKNDISSTRRLLEHLQNLEQTDLAHHTWKVCVARVLGSTADPKRQRPDDGIRIHSRLLIRHKQSTSKLSRCSHRNIHGSSDIPEEEEGMLLLAKLNFP